MTRDLCDPRAPKNARWPQIPCGEPEAQRVAAFRLGEAAKGYVDAAEGRMAPQMAAPDEATGMAWWNGLDDAQRKDWMARAGNTGVAADAWAAFKRHPLD